MREGLPSIFLSNLCSINNKFDDFHSQVIALNPDIIICTETWLSSKTPTQSIQMAGYECHRTDRRNDSGRGGVAIWTKKFLRATKISTPPFDEMEVCCIQIPTSKIILAGIYIPPGIVNSNFNRICDTFSDCLDTHLSSLPLYRLIVSGDFNRYNRAFLESGFSLINIVHGATRQTANLDLIFVDRCLSNDYLTENVSIGAPIAGSDHATVLAKTKVPMKQRVVKKHVFYDLRLSNILAFERSFLGNDFSRLYAPNDIDTKCDIFYEFMYDALKSIPQKTVYLTNNDAPWISPLLKILINRRWEAYRARNWPLFNNLKAKVKQEIAKAKQSYFHAKCSDSANGLWSFVNIERGKSGRDPCDLLRHSSNPSEVLNSINEYFCSIANNSRFDFVDRLPDDGWLPDFTVEDIWSVLSRLPSKATGSDDVPTALYKKCSLILAEPIHHLINESLRQRRFPRTWKIGDIIPIPKSSENVIEKSRPINLLPIPSKIAERIILSSIRPQLTANLGTNQYGIRKRSSTTHAVIYAHDILTKFADDPQTGAAVLVSFDLSKAFDRVCHSKLLSLACQMNLPAGFLLLLRNYLSDRQQRVRIDGQKSELMKITGGVPQGSLIGPYLFGLYISSLQPIFLSNHMIKYVDDICLLSRVRKSTIVQDLAEIEADLANISDWVASNELALNMDKTTGLIHYRGGFKHICSIENAIPTVKFQDNIRFLGVHLDANLGWRSHVKFVEKKCAQRMYILRRVRSFVGVDDYIKIYQALIRSLIEYCCPAFVGISSTDSNRLEKIQRRCLKIKSRNLKLDNIADRRWSQAVNIFNNLEKLETSIAELFPSHLPSGRLAVPFCRTLLRQNSFVPRTCINLSRSSMRH